jgi:signal transduction histidine kinase
MNVVKHARAVQVRVEMRRVDSALCVIVKDDGVGFNPDAKGERPNEEGGFGLFSIRERMIDLGGSVEIVSAPGQGCRVTLIVPLGNA